MLCIPSNSSELYAVHQMAEHSSPEHGSLFSSRFHAQTEGQKSIHQFHQHRPVYEGNGLCDDPAGSSLNDEEQSRNEDFWGNESPNVSMGLNRNKEQSGVYVTNWISQPEEPECWAHGLQQQKLDSFSEAFCSSGISRMISGGDSQFNFTPTSVSFPLVLSPPPTPLPSASFSPPKQSQHLMSSQTFSQSQVRAQTEGSKQFFPALPSFSTGGFTPPIWLQLQGDEIYGTDLRHSVLQDSNSSLFVSHETPHAPSNPNSLQKDPLLQMPFNPALPLLHPPQSCFHLQVDHEQEMSEETTSWPQMVQSGQSFEPSLHLSSLHIQTSGASNESDFSCALNVSPGSSNTPPVCSSKQSIPCSGGPFSSVIQQRRVLMENWEETVPRYTPPPMLNPKRNGTGLFCNLLYSINEENRALWAEERNESDYRGYINIRPEFQAEIPDLIRGVHPEKPSREELLWKPWAELEENDTLLQQVENLLDLSSSSAARRGGDNLELALNCLYRCRGNFLAALEMLLFKSSSDSENNHYSDTAIWTLSEQGLFHKAFAIYRKDFNSIHSMVRTKQVSECIKFYYNSKKMTDKIRKQKEKESLVAAALLSSSNQVSPIPKMLFNQTNFEQLIINPPLPTSFPCKQCGKMFYKIKSRNAHMKIHRQQHEDWREKLHNQTHQHPNSHLKGLHQNLAQTHHQNQILTQNLIQNLVQSHSQMTFLQRSKTLSNNLATSQSPELIPKPSPSSPPRWGALTSGETSGPFYKGTLVNSCLTSQDSGAKTWPD